MWCALSAYGEMPAAGTEESKNRTILIKTLLELRTSGGLTSGIFDYIAGDNRELQGIRHQMLSNGRIGTLSLHSNGIASTASPTIEESKNKAILIKMLVELQKSDNLTFELFDYIAGDNEDLQMLKFQLIKNGGIKRF
jgi:hypothetical protein